MGKKQRHKEKLKLAGLDDSDSSALTQSGDEAGDSSPPPQGPSGPGTEAGTEPGEEDVERAERSSPGELFSSLSLVWWVSDAPQNQHQSRNLQKLRKVPRRAHFRVLVRMLLQQPPGPSRNGSGRLVWIPRTFYWTWLQGRGLCSCFDSGFGSTGYSPRRAYLREWPWSLTFSSECHPCRPFADLPRFCGAHFTDYPVLVVISRKYRLCNISLVRGRLVCEWDLCPWNQTLRGTPRHDPATADPG